MIYLGKKITSFMRGRYLMRLWLTSVFGNKYPTRINPETGELDPDGILVESERDTASQELYYCMHGLCSDTTAGYDKDFLNDRIWWSLATPEEQDSRIRMEIADEYMKRYAR